ncbi:hypothetical protein FKM82_025025 [Ascaphus truei]
MTKVLCVLASISLDLREKLTAPSPNVCGILVYKFTTSRPTKKVSSSICTLFILSKTSLVSFRCDGRRLTSGRKNLSRYTLALEVTFPIPDTIGLPGGGDRPLCTLGR